ncbi:MAG TPA: alpha-L-arabinofuranosidase C-terminal domain-containing protein [Tepidisphaeraceae bacterium]|nr:alpha-L-arabinofuranosidase C-terminal domain-containing protein [Tepidisphaeraceae bacterium]
MSSIEILLTEPIGTIKRNLYGQFVEHLGNCIYEGLWQNDGICEQLVGLLKRIEPPVIRWPGGCFADDYHWRDGIGAKEARPKRVNINWGNVIETNSFGTHEFIRLCRAVGAEPYISGNVGSGTPGEMRDWVEYCNYPGGSTLSDLRAAHGDAAPMKVKYWGVGNEAWGCGGHFTPEDYAGEFRRYATYLRDFGDTPVYLIACGPDGNDLDWTRRFFERLFRDYRQCGRIHGYSAHYYCGTAGTATKYTDAEWYELLLKASRVEELIVQQRGLMDVFDPERKIGLILDEWGTWHPPTAGRNPAFLWQQNTLRDGLVAAITLDAFNRHADKLYMANIAQMVNVLQALFLVEGGKVVTTPTYHVFELYKNHQGGRSVRVVFGGPEVVFTHEGQMKRLPGLSGSASLKGKTLTLTVVNRRVGEPTPATVNLRGDTGAAIVRETALSHGDIEAHNTPDEPDKVRLSEPRVLALRGGSFRYTFGAQSVTRLEMALV